MIRLFQGVSFVALYLQANTDLISQTEHLTLTAALVVAVGVLWRSLKVKDDIVLSSTQKVVEALTMTTDANRELRRVIEESVNFQHELRESVESLRDLALDIIRDKNEK